jgi:hypothetical protein
MRFVTYHAHAGRDRRVGIPVYETLFAMAVKTDFRDFFQKKLLLV